MFFALYVILVFLEDAFAYVLDSAIQGPPPALPRLSGCAVLPEYLEEEAKLGFTVSAPSSPRFYQLRSKDKSQRAGSWEAGAGEKKGRSSRPNRGRSCRWRTYQQGFPGDSCGPDGGVCSEPAPGSGSPDSASQLPGPISFTSLSKNR